MKKIIFMMLVVATASSISAQEDRLNGGYPFKHNGTTCYFYPTNGLTDRLGHQSDGMVRCFSVKHYPAVAKRVSSQMEVVAPDMFNVSYSTANEGEREARYHVIITE
jgi:hypothetical protein